jgi:hypothetical protein
MEKHLASNHSSGWNLEAFGRAAKKLSFVLLPPGIGLRAAIEKYAEITRSHSYSLAGASHDFERLMRIDAMGKAAIYVGVKLWKGYVAFDFAVSEKVVLECPRSGNATYVLSGEWREMISATKTELRTRYRHLALRIIHSQNWEAHLRAAVFGSRRSGLSQPVFVPKDRLPKRSASATVRAL